MMAMEEPLQLGLFMSPILERINNEERRLQNGSERKKLGNSEKKKKKNTS
jgi:hypothetical protein